MKPTKESLAREEVLLEAERLRILIQQTKNWLQWLEFVPGEEKEIEAATTQLQMYEKALRDIQRYLLSS
jgi:hypothetical protein